MSGEPPKKIGRGYGRNFDVGHFGRRRAFSVPVFSRAQRRPAYRPS
jgi:hypothetical protein